MDDTAADLPVNEWEVSTVHAWFSSLGFPQYEHQLEGARTLRYGDLSTEQQ